MRHWAIRLKLSSSNCYSLPPRLPPPSAPPPLSHLMNDTAPLPPLLHLSVLSMDYGTGIRGGAIQGRQGRRGLHTWDCKDVGTKPKRVGRVVLEKQSHCGRGGGEEGLEDGGGEDLGKGAVSVEGFEARPNGRRGKELLCEQEEETRGGEGGGRGISIRGVGRICWLQEVGLGDREGRMMVDERRREEG